MKPPRRRAAANLDAFLREDCEVAKSHEIGRDSGNVANESQFVNREKLTVVEKSSCMSAPKSLQPPPNNGSFLDDVGATRAGMGGKSAGYSRPVLSSPLRSPASGHSQTSGQSKGLQFSLKGKRSRSPSQMRSSQMNQTQEESHGKSSQTYNDKSSSQMSTCSNPAKMRKSVEFDFASQVFSQASSRSSQKSSSQRSSNSQLSQMSGFSVQRQNPKKASKPSRGELTRAAGYIMGSVARSIMEGSSVMVKEFLETAVGGHAAGHDDQASST